MLNSVTTKFEINILESNGNPIAAADFAQHNRCPAVVAHPNHLAQLMANRNAKRGQYLIIAALDFPAGKKFSTDKLFSAGSDISSAEGYDILLTPNKTQVESRNEMKALHEFLKQINPIVDIRWTLGAFTRDTKEIQNFLENMKVCAPKWIRVDQHLDLPNISLKDHNKIVKLIKKTFNRSIKLSGNVDLKLVKKYRNKDNIRFDVTMEQAVTIVKALEKELTEEAITK